MGTTPAAQGALLLIQQNFHCLKSNLQAYRYASKYKNTKNEFIASLYSLDPLFVCYRAQISFVLNVSFRGAKIKMERYNSCCIPVVYSQHCYSAIRKR